MAKFKEGDSVRVLVGIYAGKQGRVEIVTNTAPKGVGVRVYGEGKMTLPLTWFREEEIELVSQ